MAASLESPHDDGHRTQIGGTGWSWHSPTLVAVVGVAAVLAAYLPAMNGDFLSDDHVYIAGNEALLNTPLSEPWRFFIERTNRYEFLPLRDLSYRLDVELFGLEPLGFHIHNLILYALCCLAAWLAARAILLLLTKGDGHPKPSRKTTWVPTVVAVVFAAHPAHVEAVAWVSCRKELLMGLFVLLSLWQFAKALDTAEHRVRRLLLAYLCQACALMSKSPSVAMAAPMGLLALARVARAGRRQRWPAFRFVSVASIPVLALSLAWLAISVGVGWETGTRGFAAAAEGAGSAPLSLLILGRLSDIVLLPTNLQLIHEVVETSDVETVWLIVLGVAALLLGTAGAVQAVRRRAVWGFGAAFFLAMVLPYLQLVPFQTWSLASERFVFIASFGAVLAVAVLAIRLPHRTAPIIVSVLVLAGVVATAGYAKVWANREALIERTGKQAPRSWVAQTYWINNVLIPQSRWEEALAAANGLKDPFRRRMLQRYLLTMQAMGRGDWEAAQRHARGLGHVTPSWLSSWQLTLGRLAERRNDFFEAARHYHRAWREAKNADFRRSTAAHLQAIRSRYSKELAVLGERARRSPSDVVAVGQLANLEMELFMLEEAESRYRLILQRHPDLPVALYNLGLTLSRQGRHKEAVRYLELAADSGLRTATTLNNLALELSRLGDHRGALLRLEQALAVDPAHCHAAVNRGRMLLVLRRHREALEALKHARVAACGEDQRDLVRSLEETADPKSSRPSPL